MITADTLSQVTILSVDLCHRLHLPIITSSQPFTALDGTTLRSVGRTVATLTLNGRRVRQAFPVFDMPRLEAILGTDLLHFFGLGLSGVPLTHSTTPFSSPQTVDPTVSPSDAASDQDDPLASPRMTVLASRAGDADVRLVMDAVTPLMQINANIPHDQLCTHPCALVHIPTTPQSSSYWPERPIPPAKKDLVEAELQSFLGAGKIRDGNPRAPFNIPLHAVWKSSSDGNKFAKIRLAFDLRGLNEILNVHLQDNIPSHLSMLEKLRKFTIASTLDLTGAFGQIPLASADTHKTTFRHDGRCYECVSLPLGLKHASSEFQSILETILAPCREFITIYIDDIAIISDSAEEHIQHLRSVISLLNKANLRLSPSKCHFGYTRLNYLGHLCGHHEVRIDPAKAVELAEVPRPSSPKEVQRFLGKFNFVRQYLPFFSQIASPIIELSSNSTTPFTSEWSEACEASYITVTSLISAGFALKRPVPGHKLHVATDASQYGIGALLYQEIDGEKHFIDVFSRSLNKAQRNYSCSKRELFGCVHAIKAFRHHLEGVDFNLLTDHQSLVYAFSAPEPSYAIADWIHFLSQFSVTLTHIPGALNIIPDHLSRLYEPVSSLLRARRPHPFQEAFSQAGRAGSLPSSSLPLIGATLVTDELVSAPDAELRAVIAARLSKTVPPDSARADLLTDAHALAHRGADYMFRHLWKLGHFWPSMRKDCQWSAANCLPCLKFNVSKKTFAPSHAESLAEPMSHVSIDLADFSNKPAPDGSTFVLVYTDLFSGYTILKSLADKSAPSITSALVTIMSDFGFPSSLRSDNGKEFCNQLVADLLRTLAIPHSKSAPWNPQANGACERKVQSFKMLLHKIAPADSHDFPKYLSRIQLALNLSPRADMALSPYEILFGRAVKAQLAVDDPKPITISAALSRCDYLQTKLWPALSAHRDKVKAAQAERVDASHVTSSTPLAVGSLAMRRNPRRTKKSAPIWLGPYRILKVSRAGTYSLQDTDTLSLLPSPVPRHQIKAVMLQDELVPPSLRKSSDPDATDFYEVEKILSHRGPSRLRQYHVKWLNYDEPTWEPAVMLNEQLISDYDTTMADARRLALNERQQKSLSTQLRRDNARDPLRVSPVDAAHARLLRQFLSTAGVAAQSMSSLLTPRDFWTKFFSGTKPPFSMSIYNRLADQAPASLVTDDDGKRIPRKRQSPSRL